MAIEVPSFWDYLGQGIQQGHESFTAERKKRADQAMSNAQLMTQLYGAGAADSGQLQGALGTVPGMQGVKINPSQQELGRTPGTQEYQHRAAAASADKTTLQAADVQQRWLGGQPITEEEGILAKLPTAQEISQIREAKADPILERAGTQYVDQAVLGMGGRLDPTTASQVSQQAYQKYIQEYQAAGLGTLTPQQQQNASRYFSSRAMALLIKQREDDTSRINASNNNRSTIQPADRMFAQLTSLLENNRKTLDDFLQSNPGIENMVSKYSGNPDAAPPLFKGKIARYNMLIGRTNDLQTAQGQLAMGVVPSGFANLLTQKGPTAGADPKVEAGLQALQSGGKLSDLPGLVQSGRLTQAQADEIRRRASASK